MWRIRASLTCRRSIKLICRNAFWLIFFRLSQIGEQNNFLILFNICMFYEKENKIIRGSWFTDFRTKRESGWSNSISQLKFCTVKKVSEVEIVLNMYSLRKGKHWFIYFHFRKNLFNVKYCRFPKDQVK